METTLNFSQLSNRNSNVPSHRGDNSWGLKARQGRKEGTCSTETTMRETTSTWKARRKALARTSNHSSKKASGGTKRVRATRRMCSVDCTTMLWSRTRASHSCSLGTSLTPRWALRTCSTLLLTLRLSQGTLPISGSSDQISVRSRDRELSQSERSMDMWHRDIWTNRGEPPWTIRSTIGTAWICYKCQTASHRKLSQPSRKTWLNLHQIGTQSWMSRLEKS